MDFSKVSPVGKQTGLAISSTAGGLTLPSGAKIRAALIQNTGGAIRFWVDGSTPTASQGHRLDTHDMAELESFAEANNFSGIREGSVDGTLEVTYFE